MRFNDLGVDAGMWLGRQLGAASSAAGIVRARLLYNAHQGRSPSAPLIV
jgi:hypothetical protein